MDVGVQALVLRSCQAEYAQLALLMVPLLVQPAVLVSRMTPDSMQRPAHAAPGHSLFHAAGQSTKIKLLGWKHSDTEDSALGVLRANGAGMLQRMAEEAGAAGGVHACTPAASRMQVPCMHAPLSTLAHRLAHPSLQATCGRFP